MSWEITKDNELVHNCVINKLISTKLSNGDWYCLRCFAKAPPVMQFIADIQKCRQVEKNSLVMIEAGVRDPVVSCLKRRCEEVVIMELTHGHG